MNLFSEIKMLKNLTKCIKIHRKLIFCGKCLICKACGQSKNFMYMLFAIKPILKVTSIIYVSQRIARFEYLLECSVSHD